MTTFKYIDGELSAEGSAYDKSDGYSYEVRQTDYRILPCERKEIYISSYQRNTEYTEASSRLFAIVRSYLQPRQFLMIVTRRR